MTAWEGSHHAKAWTAPTAENVLGDFDDATFEHHGIITRFFRDGETFMIETDGPTGAMTAYPVHSVVGVAPLQQYLLETEPGRLQSFDVVWDTEKKLWYHLYPDQQIYADDGLHWTGPYKNYNARCAECHATDFAKNYTPTTRSYASTQSEIGVGCEACHGPGEAHVAWAQGVPDALSDWPLLGNRGLTVEVSVGGETALQQCAGCHARREPFEDGNPLPGTGFHDAYRLSTLREGMYHADGQILEEVYVYGSFLQSKMYRAGVTCANCHTPHSATLRDEGNGLCTQCHAPEGHPDFPTLELKSYDASSHHFHEAGTEAATCKSCHMIERDYMVVDGRRDHSFRIPRPDLSVEAGGPDACTDCHTDKTSSWAAAAIERWYPDSPNRGPHFGQVLATGREDLTAAAGDLTRLALDPEQAGIVRATALYMLAREPSPDLASQLATTLSDTDPLVRAYAVAVQRGAPAPIRVERLAGLLADPVRSVRMNAAREFLTLSSLVESPDLQTALSAAMRDWQASLMAKADYPETQLTIAGVAMTTRRPSVALKAFEEAVALDPQREEAWIMIVRLNAALGNDAAARQALETASGLLPDSVALSQMAADLR